MTVTYKIYSRMLPCSTLAEDYVVAIANRVQVGMIGFILIQFLNHDSLDVNFQDKFHFRVIFFPSLSPSQVRNGVCNRTVVRTLNGSSTHGHHCINGFKMSYINTEGL